MRRELSSLRPPQLSADLAEILALAGEDVRRFTGARMLVTGGTGFVGTWLLWSIVEANRRLGTRITVDVLSRNPEAFTGREAEIVSSPGVRLIRGDVIDPLPVTAVYDAIVHAATPASAALLADAPHIMLDTILRGSRNVATIAERCGPIPMLFTSSGAVYGRVPTSIHAVDETYQGAPDPTDPRAAYQEGKRCGELICAISAERTRGRAILARLFAFVGPYLPLDRHFAIGNFLRDRLAVQPIAVAGDGTAIRSYLYASDMVVWLWAAFARGDSRRAYNIGSEEAITIAELSQRIAKIEEPLLDVRIDRQTLPETIADRYVPSNQRIRKELGVEQRVQLNESLRRTLQFHRERR